MRLRIEVPECARCCVCLPLRYGIITLGLINIVLDILLLLGVETTVYRGITLKADAIMILVLYSLEIVFHWLLVIGAFMKRARCLHAYFYYGLITSSAALVCFLLGFTELGLDVFTSAFAFCGLVLQIYLILLVRSLLRRWQQTHCYVGQAGEVAVPAGSDHILL